MNIMEKLTLPTLKSCRHKYAGANDHNVNDRLSQLPLDIQLLILSYLPLEESTRTCVLSHEWKHIWKYLPVLFFQVKSSAIERIEEKFQLVSRRSDFVRWVNSIVEAHLGSSIDDFKVIFDLDINNELTIDKWVVFALSKQVKRLELNFTPGSTIIRYIDCYTWPLECRLPSLGLHRKLSSLRSLCLKFVNINDEDIKGILLSCHDLENLCIISGSLYLKRIEIPHASLQLKHLEVACLPKLLCIDILTPKLVSLTYQGHPITLNIRDAALLSDVSIGNGRREGEVVTYAYSSLAKYFPQLTSLSWDLLLNPEIGAGHIKWNLGIKNPPVMTNLKHLEIHVKARCDESLLGWVSLIEASPVLEKLSVKFAGRSRIRGKHRRNIDKRKVEPLKSLKILELINFVGLPIEMEFATFLVLNSVCLKEVIQVISRSSYMNVPIKFRRRFPDLIVEFRSTLPPGAVFRTSVCDTLEQYIFYT